MLLTDARSKLLSLAEANAQAVRRRQPFATEVHVAKLDWTDEADLSGATGGNLCDGDVRTPDAGATTAAAACHADVVLGSDISYTPESVGPLAALLERLAAPLTLIIGPAGRPSMRALYERLAASAVVAVEERKLTLVSANADDADTRRAAAAAPAAAEEDAEDDTATMRSCGVHSLLIVRPRAA